MADLTRFMPELAGEEAQHVGSLLVNMSDEQAASFTFSYRSQRRAETTFLILTMFSLGRFYLGQIGMGILYVFTASVCFVGAIADLVNHKKIIAEYNRQVAQRLAGTAGFSPFAAPPAYAPPQTPQAAPPVPSTPPATQVPPAAPSVAEQQQVPPEQPDVSAAPAQPNETAPESQTTDNLFETLERLADLHERGILSDEEFQAQKDRLLNQ